MQELLHFNGTFSLHDLLSGTDEVRAREMAKGVFHSKRNITAKEVKYFESVMWNRKQFIKYRCENHPKSKLDYGHRFHHVLQFNKIFFQRMNSLRNMMLRFMYHMKIFCIVQFTNLHQLSGIKTL